MTSSTTPTTSNPATPSTDDKVTETSSASTPSLDSASSDPSPPPPEVTDPALLPPDEDPIEAKSTASEELYNIRFRRQKIGALIIPYHYEVWLDGIYRRRLDQADKYPKDKKAPYPSLKRNAPKEHKDVFLQKIEQRPVYVTDRGISPEDGGGNVELVQLTWLYESRQDNHFSEGNDIYKTSWVKLSQICDSKQILNLSELRIPVDSSTAQELMKFLKKMYEDNLRTLSSKKVVKRTGYYSFDGGYHGWLVGKTFVGASDVVVDHSDGHKLQRAYHVRGKEEEWKAFTKSLIDDYPVARWIMAASFAAPLLRLLGDRTFVVHHYAPSKSGKTAMTLLAQSAWGDPDQQKWTLNATENAMTEVFRYVSDLPILFDELQTMKRKENLSNVIYSWCNEIPKERVRRDGGLRVTSGSWRTLIRVTGEESLLSQTGDVGGQSTRVLEISDLGIPESKAIEIYRFLGKRHYGHAGLRYLGMLSSLLNLDPSTGRATGFWDKVLERRASLDVALREASPDGQFANRLTAIALGEILMLIWIYGYSSQDAYTTALQDAIMIQDNLTSSMDDRLPLHVRALEKLRGHRVTSPKQYVNLEGAGGHVTARHPESSLPVIAFETEDEVWYNPEESRKLFQALFHSSIDAKRIWGDLKREGFLKTSKNSLQLRRERSSAGIPSTAFYVLDKAKFLPSSETRKLDPAEMAKFSWDDMDKFMADVEARAEGRKT